MEMRIPRISVGLIVAAVIAAIATAASAGTTTVIASGLNNPRGLTFGPDGTLYVAEAGTGGSGPCITNSEPNYVCFGNTGSITQVRRGEQTRIVTGLPSLAAPGGGGATGPHDVSMFRHRNLLVSIGLGAPPSNTAPGGPLAGTGLGTVIRLNGHSGHWKTVADIAAYEAAVNPDGTDLDTNPYGLLALRGATLVADAGGNSVLAIWHFGHGHVTTIAAFPPTMVNLPFPPFTPVPMDPVPTSVARGPNGLLYAGQLTGFPFPVGGSTVWRLSLWGPKPFRTGFTNVVDITFGPDGSLYVLEIDSSSLLFPPVMIGSLIKVAPDGTRTTVADGLFSPGGVALGPEGDDADDHDWGDHHWGDHDRDDDDVTPYVTVCSVCPGGGQVLRLGGEDDEHDEHGDD